MNYSVLDDESWKPKNSVDSRHYIWDILFKVRVPKEDLMSEEYIRTVGIPVSGDEALDNIMKNEVITTWLNIDRMAEIFRVGGQIRLVDLNDCVKAYVYIDNHLETWKQHLENSPLNSGLPPVDDMVLLDELSEALFQHARWDLVSQDKLSFLKRKLGTQYKYSVAALQEAIPTMASILAKQKNDEAKAAGSNLSIASPNDVVGASSFLMDAHEMKADISNRTEAEIFRQLPKRISYSSFFEKYRHDQTISTVAPNLSDRFSIPTKALQSLNSKLGRK